MVLATLIGIMIAIVVGVNMIPVISEVAQEAKSGVPEEELPAGVSALLDILPIVFVAVLLLGTVAWIGGGIGGGGGGRVREFLRLSGRFSRFPNSSFTKNYFYKRQLDLTGDELFEEIGVTGTLVDNLKDNSVVDEEPIVLNRMTNGNMLAVDTNFEWIPVEKHEKHVLYKVVGLHRKQRGLNCIYLVGKDSHTDTPYILRCPPEFLRATLQECVAWNIGMDKGDHLVEV